MRRLTRIVWLGLKEIVSLARDAVMLGLLAYSFTFAILTESTGTSTSVNNASIAFVDEDGSQLSRSLAAAFFPPEFKPVERIPARRIDAAMDGGEYLFVVVVPPGFEEAVRRGRTPQIQVLIDATAMEQAGIGNTYIVNILADEVARFAARTDARPPPAAELVLHSAFNPNRDTVRFQSVVSLINHITIMTVVLTGAALMREREHGTIEHLLAMPLSPVDIALAKIWSNAGVVLVCAMLAMAGIVEWYLGVEIAGSRALFLAGAGVYLFSATALGVFLATISRSMAQFALLFILTIMPMQLLSGADTPIEGQPDWLQTLTLALPSRHFIHMGQAILYKGAGIENVWTDFAAMGVLGAALFAGSVALFRRSVAAGG